MRAIDMHVHVPRQPGLPEMAIEPGLRRYFKVRSAPERGDELAAAYAEWDIVGVVFSVDAETTTGEPPDTNDYVAGIVKDHPAGSSDLPRWTPGRWKPQSRSWRGP